MTRIAVTNAEPNNHANNDETTIMTKNNMMTMNQHNHHQQRAASLNTNVTIITEQRVSVQPIEMVTLLENKD